MTFACTRMYPRLTALALIPLLNPTVASADVSAAAIEGIVRSDTRTPVVANVSLASPSGRYRTTTDNAGHFVVTGLVADTAPDRCTIVSVDGLPAARLQRIVTKLGIESDKDAVSCRHVPTSAEERERLPDVYAGPAARSARTQRRLAGRVVRSCISCS